MVVHGTPENRFDRSLWRRSAPSHDLGWMEASDSLLEEYAQDIERRIEALQAHVRGYFQRTRIIREEDARDYPATDVLPVQAPEEERRSRFVSKPTGEKHITISSLLRSPKHSRAFENLDFSDTQAQEMPDGWRLEWISSSNVQFYHDLSGLKTSRHPLQGDADLACLEDFDITVAWQSHRVRRVPSGEKGNTESRSEPTIGKLALQDWACKGQYCARPQYQAECSLFSSSGWVNDQYLCSVCRHLKFDSLLAATDVDRLPLKPLHSILVEERCSFCRLVAQCAKLNLPPHTLERCTGDKPVPMPCSIDARDKMSFQISFGTEESHESKGTILQVLKVQSGLLFPNKPCHMSWELERLSWSRILSILAMFGHGWSNAIKSIR